MNLKQLRKMTMNKLTDFTNTTASNNSKPEEITLERIQEAAKILNNLPPVPKLFKCSKNVFDSIKENKHILMKEGFFKAFNGIELRVVAYLTDNQLEVDYTDGTSKILKIKD